MAKMANVFLISPDFWQNPTGTNPETRFDFLPIIVSIGHFTTSTARTRFRK